MQKIVPSQNNFLRNSYTQLIKVLIRGIFFLHLYIFPLFILSIIVLLVYEKQYNTIEKKNLIRKQK